MLLIGQDVEYKIKMVKTGVSGNLNCEIQVQKFVLYIGPKYRNRTS